jgi:hypothetical protein
MSADIGGFNGDGGDPIFLFCADQECRVYLVDRQLLSRRILIFYSDQVFWHCCNGMEYEDVSEKNRLGLHYLFEGVS